MPPGKLAAQAGHAFTGAYLRAIERDPSIRSRYEIDDGPGTKVCLKASNEWKLRTIMHKIEHLGLPCYLVIDSGHIMPPHFTGEPIITALGIGPCTRAELNNVLAKLSLA